MPRRLKTDTDDPDAQMIDLIELAEQLDGAFALTPSRIVAASLGEIALMRRVVTEARAQERASAEVASQVNNAAREAEYADLARAWKSIADATVGAIALVLDSQFEGLAGKRSVRAS
jgi:hypothetical protein